MGTGDTVTKPKKPAQATQATQLMPEVKIKAGTRTEDEKRRERQMQEVKNVVSHTGIFAVINKEGAQNVVLVKNELSSEQLTALAKAQGISTANVKTETKKKKAGTEGTVARK